MTKLEINFSGLSEQIGNIDEIACEMIDEAMPIYVDAIKQSLKAVIEHEGDSELVESIEAYKAIKCKDGCYMAKIKPKGDSKTKYYYHKKTHRKHAVSNGLKAIWLEYGIPGKQAPRPYMTYARLNSTESVMKKMQEVYDRKTGAL